MKARIEAVMLQPYPKGRFGVKVARLVPFTSVEGHVSRQLVSEKIYLASIQDTAKLNRLIKRYLKLNELNAHRLVETAKKENERKNNEY